MFTIHSMSAQLDFEVDIYFRNVRGIGASVKRKLFYTSEK